MVGRSKLYYGGTGHDNQQGLGVQLAPPAETGAEVVIPAPGVQAARSDGLSGWWASTGCMIMVP